MSDISVSVSSSQTTVTDDGTCDVTDHDSLISIHNFFFGDDSGERLIEASEIIIYNNKNETKPHNLSHNNIDRNDKKTT